MCFCSAMLKWSFNMRPNSIYNSISPPPHSSATPYELFSYFYDLNLFLCTAVTGHHISFSLGLLHSWNQWFTVLQYHLDWCSLCFCHPLFLFSYCPLRICWLWWVTTLISVPPPLPNNSHFNSLEESLLPDVSPVNVSPGAAVLSVPSVLQKSSFSSVDVFPLETLCDHFCIVFPIVPNPLSPLINSLCFVLLLSVRQADAQKRGILFISCPPKYGHSGLSAQQRCASIMTFGVSGKRWKVVSCFLSVLLTRPSSGVNKIWMNCSGVTFVSLFHN